MQTVNYIGTSHVRTITAGEFTSVGVTNPDASWNPTNSYSVVVQDAAAVYLLSTGEFVLDGGITFTELVDSLSAGTDITALAVPPQKVGAGPGFDKSRLDGVVLFPALVDGVMRQVSMKDISARVRSSDGSLGIPAAAVTFDIPKTARFIMSANTAACAVTLPDLDTADFPHPAMNIIQGAAGVLTFSGATNAIVQSRGNRFKSAGTAAFITATPVYEADFAGLKTIWNLSGDLVV